MAVGTHFCLLMGCEGRCTALNRCPPCSLLTHLATVALAGLTDSVAALISTNTLPSDLLTADPAQELPFHLPQLDLSQLLQSQLVLTARTEYSLSLLVQMLHLVDVGRSIF